MLGIRRALGGKLGGMSTPTVHNHIGQTPLVQLLRLGHGSSVSILVTCEHLNPGGSLKDRIALAIVDDASDRYFSKTWMQTS